jgi:murein DD-endopeptidase MepM/ murein hydrolase activator NlpD
MIFRIGIIVFLLGLFAFGLYGEDKVHIVQKGETFYSIARTLGIKSEDLMKYNGITDPSRLQAGQRLKIPLSGSADSPALRFTTYKVVRGDTFYSITRKFSVSQAAILEANGLPQNYVLKEGDSLKIPAETPNPQITRTPAEPVQSPAVTSSQGVTGLAETVNVNTSIRWPVNVRELSYLTGKLSGVAITGTRAESVNSLTWGTVLSAGPYRGFGKVVIIQVDGGYLYVYGGCESLTVKEGDRISPGTELGKLGVDVVSGKPQLFFMVYRSNAPIDPAKAPRA